MIIKRQKNSSGTSPADEAKLPLEELAPPPLEWNEETVQAGLVPERRVRERSADRRRSYRRIEDRNLISKAHEEATAIREQAHEQGFQEGLQQAKAVIEELRETITRLLNVREEALLSITGDIAALAVEVAARIIKTEVSCDETLVMGLVRDTIQKAGRQSKTILIKVNPDETAVVKRMLKEEPIPNLDAELIVMDEPTVDAGSCIVETNSGLIDASFSTQLGILKQLFGGQG
jgi:flagellar biosynthesis/type III secretory pathway protein FliH